MSGKAILKEIGSTLLYIVVVLGITWLVITFVGQRTEVNGSSMEPTLSNNDNLMKMFTILSGLLVCPAKRFRSARTERFTLTDRCWRKATARK